MVEVHRGAGRLRPEAGGRRDCGRRKTGISEATFYAWRRKYAGLLPSEMKGLRQFEEENAKLKRMVAYLSLDKAMLQDAISRKLSSLIAGDGSWTKCVRRGGCRSDGPVSMQVAAPKSRLADRINQIAALRERAESRSSQHFPRSLSSRRSRRGQSSRLSERTGAICSHRGRGRATVGPSREISRRSYLAKGVWRKGR